MCVVGVCSYVYKTQGLELEFGRRKKSRLMEMDKEKGEEKKSSKFSRICVFCGSSSGKKVSYQDAAVELGKELVINL